LSDTERPDGPETRISTERPAPSLPGFDPETTVVEAGGHVGKDAERGAREALEDLLPPASSRQPRSRKDELPLDDELPGVLDPEAEESAPASEERPPASRKVASQRGTQIESDDLGAWDIEALTEPPPTRKAQTSRPDRAEPGLRIKVERGAPARPGPSSALPPDIVDVLTRPIPEGEIARVTGALRAPRPATFGDLLDATLALGEDDHG
jgi:hypothetical protein